MTTGSTFRSVAASAALALILSTPLGAEEASPPWVVEFREVWSVVRDRFYDAALGGLDWNAVRARYEPLVAASTGSAEAALRINEMLSELRTSHTRYYTADDPEYYYLLQLFSRAESVQKSALATRPASYLGIGVFTAAIGEQVFVRSVVDGSPAQKAGILSGDRIVSVDGQPWHPIRSFAGKFGRVAQVRVQRSADPASVLDLEVRPVEISPVEFYLGATGASARRIEREGRSIGYIRVWSYAGQIVQDLIVRQLAEGPLAGADGLILDLRDGWGGASPEYLDVFSRCLPLVTWTHRGGDTQELPQRWKKPVALLVDKTTRSGKEVLAFGFRRYRLGTVIGERTAGALVGGGAFPIADRGLLYLAVSDVHVDGERLEGVGVAPDIEVPFALPYSEGRDPRLEQALHSVLAELGATASSTPTRR